MTFIRINRCPLLGIPAVRTDCPFVPMTISRVPSRYLVVPMRTHFTLIISRLKIVFLSTFTLSNSDLLCIVFRFPAEHNLSTRLLFCVRSVSRPTSLKNYFNCCATDFRVNAWAFWATKLCAQMKYHVELVVFSWLDLVLNWKVCLTSGFALSNQWFVVAVNFIAIRVSIIVPFLKDNLINSC